jgi:hypothetical protein
MNDEERNGTHWSRTPVCSCTGGGNPTLLDGQMVIFRNPSCRVHVMTLSFANIPLSAETLVGNWEQRERITK